MHFRHTNHAVIIEVVAAFAARFLGVLAAIALTWVIPQLADVQSLGLYMIGYSITLGVGTIARLGSSLQLVRWGVRTRNAGNTAGLLYMFGSAASMSSLLCTLLSLALVACWLGPFQLIDAPGGLDAMLPFLIAAPASSILFIYSAYCKVIGRPNLSPIFESVAPTCLTILGGIALTLSGLADGASGFSWSFCIAVYLVAIIGLLVAAGRGRMPLRPLARGMAHFPNRKDEWTEGTVDFALIDILNYSFQYGIIVLVGFMVGDHGAGVFTVLMRITLTLNFIVVVFNSVTIARFADLHGRNDIAGLARLANRTSAYMMLCALPVAGAVGLFPQHVLDLFGEGLSSSWLAMLVLLAGQLINVATGSVGPILNMTGHQRQLRNLTILSILLTLILVAALAGPFGVLGVALGVTTGVAAKNLLAYGTIRMKLGVFIIPDLRRS